MDNAKQSLASGVAFNVKAYGLVNQLLQNNIPVNWVIKDNKSKDEADFSVTASRVYPSTANGSTLAFDGGPFVIDSAWVSKAAPIITAFGNSVAVYVAGQPFSAPVRYELTFKPKIAVFTNGNSLIIHTKALRLAGFTSPAHFDSIPAQTLDASSCYTLVTEPHWASGATAAVTNHVTTFLNSGGNFFAQCAGISAYDNIEHLHTTNGVTFETASGNKDNNNLYPGTAHPLLQFDGQLTNAPTGTVVNYKNNGGSYQPFLEQLIKKTTSPASGVANGDVVLSSRKTGPAAVGGIASYLGGHDYLKGTFDLLDLGILGLEYARANDVTWNNGLRIFYNAIFMPSTRPTSCNFVFAADVALTSSVNNTQPCAGSSVNYTVAITNNGPGTAHSVLVKHLAPAGLTFASATATQGTYNSSTGTWTAGDIPPATTLNLVLTYTVPALGSYTFKSYNADLIADNSLPNDTTLLVLQTDLTPPLITAPANVTTPTNTGCTATGVALGTPATSDNCGIASVTNNAPSTFPPGATTVTWTVVDNSGNTATATQTVTVNDTQHPTITAPSTVATNTNAGCTATGVVLGTPTTSDNCTVASVTNNAPAAFPPGTTTVTWTVTDNSGNTTTATQTVTVTDVQNPTITAPAAISDNTDEGCVATDIVLGTPVTADNCGIALITNNAPAAFPLGTTIVTWTVKDNSGNTATATQTVTIHDVQHPTITAPSNVNTSTTTGCTATGVVLGTPVTADNCTVASVTNNAPAAFPLGNTTVTWTVTDNSGNTTTATQMVTIHDVQHPTITAPANVTTTTNAGCMANGVTLGTPTATDNCTVISITNNAPSIFPLGTTIVTWTATDNSGNTTTAPQTVTVTDAQNPTITAPATVHTSTNTGCTATGVALGTPVTVDNCTVASVTNNAPAAFPQGPTTVTWTVTDNSGNTATATQLVIVHDHQHPTIIAPANVTTNTNTNCTATGVAPGTPTTADNCTIASVTNNAPSAYPVGTTTVTWTVTDNAGNTTTATQTVTVTDVQNPTITAPANVATHTNAGCTATSVALGTPVTADNCTIASVTNDAPSSFPLGVTTVTWTATDNSGNTATATQTVTVTDVQNPTISAPANVTSATNDGCTATGIALGTPVTADNCTIASVTNDAPSVFPLGLTTITWTVTDNSGNMASATQTVTVTDTESPTITAPANISMGPNSGCDATSVDTGTPATSDNCGVASVTNNAPSTFPAGTTTVTWTVTDNSGNMTTATQTVTVTDAQNPTITAPAAVATTTNSGCTATGVALGTPATADNCGVASVTSDAPVSFSPGTTTVTWTVIDNAGNTATATQMITVTDSQNPTITAPANVTATTNSGCTAMGIAPGTPVTADNCGIASVTNDAPATFPLGVTTITWTATDNSGNTTTATQTVTVTDTENPTITAPVNVSANSNSGCEAENVALGTPATADNCGVASVTNNAPQEFPLGVTTVTWTATDNSGNTATATQTVTVTDAQNPTITAPANVTTHTNAGCTATTAALGIPTTSDNCGVASVTNNAPSTFPLGVTTITWTVTDNSGNTATATQTVVVSDLEPPVIASVGDTIVSCTALVSYTEPAATDNCSIASFGQTDPTGLHSGSAFPDGYTTLTYTATDASGNTAIGTKVIRVISFADAADAGKDQTVYVPEADLAAVVAGGITGEWEVISGTATLADEASAGTKAYNLDKGDNTFTWTLTNGGCIGPVDTVNIVYRAIAVPNGFSPDGDHVNDHFEILGLESFYPASLAIADRWGSVVFESSDYRNDWSGTNAAGESLTDDTYYYKLTLSDHSEFSGFILMKRHE